MSSMEKCGRAVMLSIYARRKHLSVSQWLGVVLLAFGIAFLLNAALPAGLVYEPGPNTPAIPTQAVSRIPDFGLLVLTSPPAGLDPMALLQRSDEAMNQLHTLAETQRLVGSSGTGVTATFAYQAPDRMHYQVTDGLQSVAIGDTQYYLVEGQAWEKTQRASSVHWPNFSYATDAANAKVEGVEVLDGELCAVISFKAPHVDLYRYAMGLGLPFVLAGMAISRVKPALARIKRYMRGVTYVSGVLLVLMGFLVFSNQLAQITVFLIRNFGYGFAQ